MIFGTQGGPVLRWHGRLRDCLGVRMGRGRAFVIMLNADFAELGCSQVEDKAN